MNKSDYDVIVVGSGPNGLAAAITMQQQGLSVLLVEGKEVVGGGMCTAGLTLPGFMHDVCSAIHPLAVASPFFKTLPLEQFGLKFLQPEIIAAHPFDDGTAAAFYGSVERTAEGLGEDQSAYEALLGPLEKSWPQIAPGVLGPLRLPTHAPAMARFGMKGLLSAVHVAKRFHGTEARGLWAGMAAHSMQPLSKPTTAAIALVLMAAGHTTGWPISEGGSVSIARALASYFLSLGGEIETGFAVKSLKQLPSARAVLLDITPRQLLAIAGDAFSPLYRWQLQRYRYGMGVFKIDWALDAPIPFTAPACRQAGTVHLGNTLEEIAASEQAVANGKLPERPFVLLAQQGLFDRSRAPAGKHTGWAYCHVPNGSTTDMTERIEKQVERFAPGFRDLVLGRHVMNTVDMESYDPNYVGGDINGGAIDLGQLFTRPVLRMSPYRTSVKGLYVCSASTPPGGGVHGMCGYHAAKRALKDVFNITLPLFEGQV